MKSKTLIVALLLSFLYFKGFSQKINSQRLTAVTLTVKDSTDDSLLKDIVIKIDFQRASFSSDEKGVHTLYLSQGRHSITISHIGFRTLSKGIVVGEQELNLNISLINIAKELDEVIVNSSGGGNNLGKPLLGVTPLGIKAIKRIPAMMGETDVLRGLQMLPGVTSVGEAANGVNIRGGTTDQNLILLDDTPVFNPTHMFGLFSVFPPDAVAGLDLYKGGVPARFGGRASSVIDIYLSNPNLEKFKMTGGISLIANKLTIDQPIVKNKLGILISGRASYNDFLFKLGPPKLENIKANFYDIATKLFYKINPNNTLTFSGYISKDFFQTDLLGTIGNVNATSTQYDYSSVNSSLKWFHAFNSKLNIQTTAVYTNYKPQTLLPEINTNNTVSLESGILYQQLKTSLNYTPNEHHRFEGGLSTIFYTINPGILNPNGSTSVNYKSTPEEKSMESGIHLEDEWTVNKRLTVSLGVRYSQYAALGPTTVRRYDPALPKSEYSVVDSTAYQSGSYANYGGLEPRVALKYSLNDLTSVKFGYNLMRQYLQVVSNTTTPLPTSRWTTSNQYIKPQVSELLSVGLFRNSKNTIYEFSIEGYHRTTDNVIDFKPGADFLFQPYLETQTLQGKGRAYGLELQVSKKKGNLTGWMNYTYSRALNQVKISDRFEEQINGGAWYATNYDRPHSFNATISLAQGGHHEFGFTFVYNTGRPYTVPNGFVDYNGAKYPFYADRNNDRIKDYHRLDFAWTIRNASMQKRRWEGSWTFAIYNVYGKSNAYSVYLRTENGIKAYQLTIFGQPIPSLTYNFKFM